MVLPKFSMYDQPGKKTGAAVRQLAVYRDVDAV
jgi:hypothetical protein